MSDFQALANKLGLGGTCVPLVFNFRSLSVVPLVDDQGRLLCWLGRSHSGTPRDLADARYLAAAPVWVARPASCEREWDVFEADYQGVGLVMEDDEGAHVRVRPLCAEYRPIPLSDAVRAVVVPGPQCH